MILYIFLFAAVGMVSGWAAETTKKMDPALQRFPAKTRAGTATAVKSADGPLLFTGQLFATDLTQDAGRQAGQALDQLSTLLTAAGGDMQRVLRLNVYVADDAATPAIEAMVAERFASAPPAVTWVRSPLARTGARVTFDAIAAVSRSTPAIGRIPGGAIMPPGGKVFVSGQAQKGKDLTESVQLTMEALHRSLAHIGLGKADVVQVKAFIAPFSEHAAAIAEVEKSYAGGPVPPVIVLEWVSTLPTEIELVVAVPASTPIPAEPVAFLSLPGMVTSPLYCRIATVAAGTPLIFLGGIDAPGETARDQWRDVFAQMGSVLFDAGSSFRHLVKATYFMTDQAGRQPLGDIRPTYYDPARPPAASALNVTSLGRPGRMVMLDMIAVPAR